MNVPHPQWFVDQHTKLFTKVADDADHDLSINTDGMYHPHGITESTYRWMIYDLIFSGRRIVQERDRYRASADRMPELLVALSSAREVLGAVIGDLEDGYSLGDIRAKYVTALLNARDDMDAALSRASHPQPMTKDKT